MCHKEKRWWHPANCCWKLIRRLSVKVGSRPIVQALGEELRPVQLGVSNSGGCEATAHAARRYARDCRHRRVLLKIDMRNAFNSLRRDSFLSVARVRTPGLYSLLWQAYSSPTRLFFGEEGFASETGIQQGDPIGLALFDLSVDEAARGVQSEFNVWYLDDATLVDSPERVYDDLVVLLERLRAIGLKVRGLGWWKRVTFHCWEPQWIYKAFRELSMRRGKRSRE